MLTDNIWGYLWGKLDYGALLFATALTNDSIADCLAAERYRAGLHRAGARGRRGRGGRGREARGFDGFDPARLHARAERGRGARARFDDMVAHQPQVGQDP